MRLKAYRQLGGREVVDLEATIVIVEDDVGNPLMVACEHQKGVVFTSGVKDADFNRVLAALGIDKTVICDQVSSGPPPAGAQRLIL